MLLKLVYWAHLLGGRKIDQWQGSFMSVFEFLMSWVPGTFLKNCKLQFFSDACKKKDARTLKIFQIICTYSGNMHAKYLEHSANSRWDICIYFWTLFFPLTVRIYTRHNSKFFCLGVCLTIGCIIVFPIFCSLFRLLTIRIATRRNNRFLYLEIWCTARRNFLFLCLCLYFKL